MAKKPRSIVGPNLLPQFSGRQVELHQIRLMVMFAAQALQPNEDGPAPFKLPEVIRNKVNVTSTAQQNQMVFGLNMGLYGLYEESDETPAIKIEASYGIVYSIDSLEGLSVQDINQFGQVAGVHHVWPFWREFVQSTTARMSLPLLTLPLMEMGSMKFESVESPSSDKPATIGPRKKRRK